MLRHEENSCLFCNLLVWACLHNAYTVCILCDMFTLIHIIHCATPWLKTCLHSYRKGAALRPLTTSVPSSGALNTPWGLLPQEGGNVGNYFTLKKVSSYNYRRHHQPPENNFGGGRGGKEGRADILVLESFCYQWYN